ncbi:uncharacterized protein LOC115693042 isoform X2 [Syzygium oleosum]|uniref:uncharacterized protein LOC115693042 isoform X2 n=1 Tax=Syzygium oleosum TaxID=219896 RepID=UPI0024B8A8C6|nr:uncharacterized protein LOC115693042 isoform X2 [Syzygium oleosum]
MEKILWYMCSIFSTKDVSVQRQLRVLPLVWLVVSILASFQRSNMILETLVHWILSLTASFHCLGDTLSQIYTMHRFSKEMKLKQISTIFPWVTRGLWTSISLSDPKQSLRLDG